MPRTPDGDTAVEHAALGASRVCREGNDNEQNPELLAFVQVSVSFSVTGQQYQMQQLLGGQKALVALALILAIQLPGGCGAPHPEAGAVRDGPRPVHHDDLPT